MGHFISPAAYAPPEDWSLNPVWPLGSVQSLSWTPTANSDLVLYKSTGANDGFWVGTQSSLEWTVQLYSLTLDNSPVFQLGVRQSGTSIWRSRSFNITDTTGSASGSQLSPVPAPSPIASSAVPVQITTSPIVPPSTSLPTDPSTIVATNSQAKSSPNSASTISPSLKSLSSISTSRNSPSSSISPSANSAFSISPSSTSANAPLHTPSPSGTNSSQTTNPDGSSPTTIVTTATAAPPSSPPSQLPLDIGLGLGIPFILLLAFLLLLLIRRRIKNTSARKRKELATSAASGSSAEGIIPVEMDAGMAQRELQGSIKGAWELDPSRHWKELDSGRLLVELPVDGGGRSEKAGLAGSDNDGV